MQRYAGEILLIFGLVLLNGYFAAAEIALISARRAALKAEAEKGSARARTALALTEDPSRLLAAIQVGITLVGFMASATAAVSLATGLAGYLRSLGVSWLDAFAGPVSVFLVTLAIAYVTLVLGELSPKRLGLQRAEAVALRVATPITWLARITAPVVWVLSHSTNVIARLLGVKEGGRPGVSEEELKLLVTEQGTLLEQEKQLIHEIFDLGDTVAREVMVPRVDIVMVEDTSTAQEALSVFRRTGYSRLPVFHEDPDEIVGIVLLKDLVGPAAEGSLAGPVTSYMRKATFVPETKPILSLLSDMQATRIHMVVVVDEHGGTAGVVTIEDIVEEIIGDVADEFDRDWRYITQLSPGEWVLDGRLPVYEARQKVGLDIPESEEYETVAGWVLMRLGHIPVPGEAVPLEGAVVRVQTMRRRRIVRVRVSQKPVAEEAGTESP